MSRKKVNNQIFYTLDNGGYPFKIIIRTKNKCKEVDVLKGSYVEDDDPHVKKAEKNNMVYDYLFTFKKIRKVFVGRSSKSLGLVAGKKFDGNSILLKQTPYDYIYIGDCIFSFTTEKDEIIKYHSPVGNNGVPYPFAISKQNTYLMLHSSTPFEGIKTTFQCINRRYYALTSSIEKPLDPYSDFYKNPPKINIIDTPSVKYVEEDTESKWKIYSTLDMVPRLF
jgi:hypothetical protein